ncbi:hypothetical protein OHR68_19855 [Spirillospora sp. NBC_00431]
MDARKIMQVPGCCPDLLDDVNEVDDDVDGHLAAGGLGADEVELVLSVVDQHDPSARAWVGSRAVAWSKAQAMTSSGSRVIDPHNRLRRAGCVSAARARC